jgi:hypothetical protein
MEVYPQKQLQAELQKGIDDIARGQYTTYRSGQDIAARIKTIARSRQATIDRT